ncbi:malto-oligosyltrehalose synthase [Allonocardiopsis opalescens]|uniref:malto-oligosyltrehalose synthase n=1 Tax=Allonocardiopsis opalescens TaxID=1144618 RepID=UPI003CCBE7DE
MSGGVSGGVPASTYRLQLRSGFGLDDAAEVVDYLERLGVDAVYTSPLLAAAPGSTHGYDVVDTGRTCDGLGGDAARRALVKRLRGAGMRLVVDIVPNHMSVAVPAANPWWWDVLRLGAGSPFAHYFDIDWDRGPLLVPVLGDDGDGGAAALAELRLDGDRLAYYDHRFPLAPGTAPADGSTSPDAVRAAHERQHYRLVSWRRGNTELNYRRFFDITTLAAVRVEDPEVFAAAHTEILRWVEAGEVDGLRVDHPDGLTDPGGYTRMLRAAAPGQWIVVEKILGPGEELPATWPVHGTTGYDALRDIGAVFVDPAGRDPLTALARRHGVPTDPEREEYEARLLAATTVLCAEVRRIARLVPPAVQSDRAERAVAVLLACFPVYRSYLADGRAAPLTEALRTARIRHPDLADAFDQLAALLRADPLGELAERIQQTSGMVMAKGVEDTAFYRLNAFVALNEVGGDPARFGLDDPAEFHRTSAAREAAAPATMTALSTHDTKRSEDVRARLAVLTELADEAAGAIGRWSRRTGLPEPSLDLLAWQTLLGAWPIDADRLRGYLLKAAKEAKLATSWIEPDTAFEEEVAAWPERVLGDAELVGEIEVLVERITPPGWSNALGQKLLQLAGPGVPDVYQGTELWDHSLVDPDNRRPVDYALRRELLDRLDAGLVPELDATGAAKLHLVRHVLRLRRERPGLFTGYLPLPADGPAARHAVAFARGREPGVVAVATRLPVGLAASGGWRGTVLPLPPGGWTDVLTGRPAAPPGPGVPRPPVALLAELLDRYPVALLVRDGA